MKIKENEIFAYQAVKSGDLEILPNGEIWRIRKRGWDRWQKQVVSRPCKRVRAEHDCGEYFQVRIMIDGVRVCALAHRLVYLHFKGEIPKGKTINHENGKKKDNRPENLKPATYSEQQLHATRILKMGHACDQNGEKNSKSKLTQNQVIEIRKRRKAGEPLLKIAADYPVGLKAVSKIARGDRWAHLTL